MKDKTKAAVNATASVLHDLKKIWNPYEARQLPEDHPFWDDLITSRKYYPEEGQKTIGKAILSGKYRMVFIQLARQTGKSELVTGISWYKMLLKPRSSVYYLCPKQKQAKEIVWAKKRIQTMNAASAEDLSKLSDFNNYGKKYVDKINNSEMRLSLVNGSFIKVDGSDNFDEYRGITTDLMIFDEFRDFRAGVYDALRPTISIRKGTIVIISTAAPAEGIYSDLAKEARNPDNKDSIYFQAPAWMNPYNDIEDLESTRRGFVQRGEFDVWLREYCGEFVIGGSRSIFPMLKGDEKVPHQQAMQMAEKAMDFYCICDPGSAKNGSAFAVLFAAINPYTKRIVLLDELYHTDEGTKTASVVEAAIRKKLAELAPHLSKHDWNFHYDCAAAWFREEMIERGYAFMPTNKKEGGGIDNGLSTIKDALLAKKVTWSHRCENLMWEMTNYIKKDDGRLPKKDDHLIDCFRYLLQASHYVIHYHAAGPERSTHDDGRPRWISIDEDLEAMDQNNLLKPDLNLGFLNDYM